MGVIQKLLAMILCGVLCRNVYALPAYVSDIADDMVRFTDCVAEQDWYWEPADGWNVWDNAELVMFDNFTPENPYDDVIVTPCKVLYGDDVTYVKGEMRK